MSVEQYLTHLGLTVIDPGAYRGILERHAGDARVCEHQRLLETLLDQGDKIAELEFYRFFYTAQFPDLDLLWIEAYTRAVRLDFERMTLPDIALCCQGSRTILEAGCGDGLALCYLASQQPEAEVVGIEVIPEAARFAHRRVVQLGLQNVTIVEGDLFGDVLAAQSFDRIVLRHVFGHEPVPGWPGGHAARDREIIERFRIVHHLLKESGLVWFGLTPRDECIDSVRDRISAAVEIAEFRIRTVREIPYKQMGKTATHLAWILEPAQCA